MNPTILGIALLTIADSSSFWSANNPSFFTVRHFTTEGDQKAEDTKTDIYAGGAKASIETVLVGFGGALITKSWWPLAAPLAYLGVCWMWYKWALEHPHENNVAIAQQNSRPQTEVRQYGY